MMGLLGTGVGAGITIIYAAGGGGGPAPGTANLWVDDDGGTCTRSSSAIAYNDATACTDMSDAHAASSAGDLVLVRCDTETTCSINGGSSDTISADKGSSVVTFRGEEGYTITVGTLSIPYDGTNHANPTGVSVSGSHVTFEDMIFPFFQTTGSSITFDNIDGQTWSIQGDSNGVTVKNGDYGDYQPPRCDGGNQDQPEITGGGADPTNITILRNVFHDYDNSNCPSTHLDCLQMAAANGPILIDGNKIFNCATNGFIGTADFDDDNDMDDVTIQNNWFGGSYGNLPVRWNNKSGTATCTNAVFQYNTVVAGGSSSGMSVECSSGSNMIFRGNLFAYMDSFWCGSTAMKGVLSYNLAMSGSTSGCGTNALIDASELVDVTGPNWEDYDFHLVNGAAAEASADPSNCPTSDIDGDSTRPEPSATTCDRGSDERS